MNGNNLTGKVSIVTGAARGIGLSVALRLAKEGSDVCIMDVFDGADAVEVIRKETGGSVRVMSRIVDVRDRQQVHDSLKSVVDEYGSVDVVVNNAGTCGRIDLESMTDEIWERDIATNLRGTFLLTQAAIYPYMRDQGSGRIINISSISGIMGGPYADGADGGRSGPAYAASKGGVIAFTKWVAKEVGALGITCNSVAPGPISTPMTAGMDYPMENQAIKRIGTPEDIAAAVAYLASPDAGYVTGDTLKVCGGSAIG